MASARRWAHGSKATWHRSSRDLLSAESIAARGLFRHVEVARLIADHDANREDGTDRLMALLNLEIWARIYLDRREPADVADELKAVTP